MKENETTTGGTSEVNNLQSQVGTLQQQLTILTLALLIASGTFCIYMGLLARRARHDLQTLKAATAPTIQAFQKKKPQWDDFVKKVTDYGQTHADFAPIMARYRITATSTSAAPAEATEPPSATPQPVLPK